VIDAARRLAAWRCSSSNFCVRLSSAVFRRELFAVTSEMKPLTAAPSKAAPKEAAPIPAFAGDFPPTELWQFETSPGRVRVPPSGGGRGTHRLHGDPGRGGRTRDVGGTHLGRTLGRTPIAGLGTHLGTHLPSETSRAGRDHHLRNRQMRTLDSWRRCRGALLGGRGRRGAPLAVGRDGVAVAAAGAAEAAGAVAGEVEDHAAAAGVGADGKS